MVARLAGLTSVGAEGVGGGGGAVTVSVALRLTPPKLAVIVTGVEVVTVVVVMANVTVVEPAGTAAVPGTPATLLLLDNATTAPPCGADPLSVTVPDDEAPPDTVDGVSASDDTVTAPGGGGAPGSTHRIG
jgi:hypothetical protein